MGTAKSEFSRTKVNETDYFFDRFFTATRKIVHILLRYLKIPRVHDFFHFLRKNLEIFFFIFIFYIPRPPPLPPPRPPRPLLAPRPRPRNAPPRPPLIAACSGDFSACSIGIGVHFCFGPENTRNNRRERLAKSLTE